MIINGLDLVDFGQQLGIGGLCAKYGGQKDEGKGYRGFLDHGRFVLRACARRVNRASQECKKDCVCQASFMLSMNRKVVQNSAAHTKSQRSRNAPGRPRSQR